MLLGLSMLTLPPLTAAHASGSGATPTVPRTYQSALSPADIARFSANPTDRVIVLMRNQHPEVSGAAGQRALRSAALRSDQAQITGELSALHAPAMHAYSFVNAVAATVSTAEAARLATNPAVAAVVPDTLVTGPTAAQSAAATAAVPLATPAAAPVPGVCPTDPAVPLLEPEALQLMNVEFQPGSSKPAAHDLATGKGVKIAVFPDGLDPNIPDFKRPDGTPAIFDYQDFSGEGLAATTGGAEAFGDASSLIAQGNQTFDLSGEVNAALPLPAGCTIRIKGVAPDASVAVMKVFGNANTAFNSLILQGIDYAVAVDGVDVLSQSFGGNPVPNPGLDPIAVFDQEAVAAGVTVVVSSGDAGTTGTIGTPATVPGVISAGASTSYQLYAQTSSYGYQLFGNGWESNNVSAFSSSGTTEYGPRTIDVVAPGESGWADCSTDTKTFTECADIYHGPAPQPLDVFGGTSQSCPFTAGTAALVIQAYRDTHGGASPTPALVKDIIMSTAQDLGVPAGNQGAGLVDALRAVQAARSIQDGNGTPTAGGQSLLYSPSSISFTAPPGETETVPVTVTNNGTLPQDVTPEIRVPGGAKTIAEGDLALDPATDPTFQYMTGARAHDVHTVDFTVRAGTDRLVSRIAWLGNDAGPGGHTVRADLFDPLGRLAAQSRPQGAGGGFAEDEIHNPAPGTWTLMVFDATGSPYTGTVHYSLTGARFHDLGAASPSSLTIAPGSSATFDLDVTTPDHPGDRAEAVTFDTAPGGAAPQATIPVLLRSLVPVDREDGGTFRGTLTGGNARMAFFGQELVYQFDVPSGVHALSVDVAAEAPGNQLFGFLVDPGMSPVDVQSTTAQSGSGVNGQTMHFSWANPVAGRWNIDLATLFGSQSLLTSVPITGTISFDRARVSADDLPRRSSTTLPAGQTLTATVHVVNTGSAPADYSIDPRLSQDAVLSLGSLNPPSGRLPITDTATVPQFVVPPFSTELDMAAQSTVPINFTTSPSFGFPEILSVGSGDFAALTYQAPDIPASVWSLPPTEIGPGPSVTTTFISGAAAVTKAFDPAVDSSTGNIWSALEGLTPNYAPLILQPGESGDISVTITPGGTAGQVVTGFLAVETFNFNTLSSDQLARIPYSYTVG